MKLIMLLSRCPYPLEKGDKLRAYHQLKEWSKIHQIHLFFVTWKAPTTIQLQALSPYCKSITYCKLNIFSFLYSLFYFVCRGQALQCAFFYSPRAKKRFVELGKELEPDFIFCQLIRMVPYTKDLDTNKILDYQDVFSYGLYRRLQVAPWYLQLPLRYEYRAMKKMEFCAFSQFEIKTIISRQDRALMSHPSKAEIKILPNGVDTTYFTPPIRLEKELLGNFDIVFTGNMSYPPNEDAAVFLVKEIYPILKITHPHLRILIAGATPSIKVRALSSPDIIVSGWMDDIRLAYLSARVFVAPMRLGTGMQNKLLEAMSMGLACVTTTLVAKGLGVNSNETSIFEVCETNPALFAEKIKLFLDNPQSAAKIGEQARNYVEKHFSWEAQAGKMNQWLIDYNFNTCIDGNNRN